MKPISEGPQIYDMEYEQKLIGFIELLLHLFAARVGGGTSLNEMIVAQHLTIGNSREESITVSGASSSLEIPKSTVSRILTEMRYKGLTVEKLDPADKRKHTIRWSGTQFDAIRREMRSINNWCRSTDSEIV